MSGGNFLHQSFVINPFGHLIPSPMLDAMKTGVPVITTGRGGQRDFFNDRNVLLIDNRLTDVAEKFYLKYSVFYGVKWAEPDKGDVIRKMPGRPFQNRSGRWPW